MNNSLRIIQLNVRKQDAVLESLMNDEDTRNAVALAIQEPQARRIQGRLLTTPMGHHKWTKMVPSTWREGRWAIRSMLWVNKEVEAEQVPVESPDITVATIRLPGRLIFMASVYVEGGSASALDDACNLLRDAITKVRRETGAVVESLIVGDFNRHDQLWGGDEVLLGRQGEADPIIDLMNEFALSSLLKRGTKTWHGGGQSGDCESTIDLVLASGNLTDSMTKCNTLRSFILGINLNFNYIAAQLDGWLIGPQNAKKSSQFVLATPSFGQLRDMPTSDAQDLPS